MLSADDWVRHLALLPHPEGGYYREIYRNDEDLAGEHLPARYGAPRSFSTSIYYLLRRDQRSRLHRLKSDEVWYYHAGGVAVVHLLMPDGRYEQRRIGADATSGTAPQVAIPRGCWFGATVEAGDYILVGCSVAPGFDFADFEVAEGATLLRLYPSHGREIAMLCG